jgi:hypothetical protein
MTYLEQYHPAFAAELIDLAELVGAEELADA